MGEFLKITYKKNKGIKIKGRMTTKHIDDAIRDLKKLRMQLVEQNTAASRVRKAAPAKPKEADTRVVSTVTEAVCFAIVGSVNADRGQPLLLDGRTGALR